MKVEKFSRFEKLEAGQWLSDGAGVYEVVEPFNDNTRCIRAAEVLFNEVDGGQYRLADSSLMTFADLRHADII